MIFNLLHTFPHGTIDLFLLEPLQAVLVPESEGSSESFLALGRLVGMAAALGFPVSYLSS